MKLYAGIMVLQVILAVVCGKWLQEDGWEIYSVSGIVVALLSFFIPFFDQKSDRKALWRCILFPLGSAVIWTLGLFCGFELRFM